MSEEKDALPSRRAAASMHEAKRRDSASPVLSESLLARMRLAVEQERAADQTGVAAPASPAARQGDPLPTRRPGASRQAESAANASNTMVPWPPGDAETQPQPAVSIETSPAGRTELPAESGQSPVVSGSAVTRSRNGRRKPRPARRPTSAGRPAGQPRPTALGESARPSGLAALGESARDPSPPWQRGTVGQPIGALDERDVIVLPGGKPERRRSNPRRRFQLVAAIAAVVLLLGGGGLAYVLGLSAARAGPGLPTSSLDLAVRSRAAAWISSQVSSATTIGCDPVMCAALLVDGVPTDELLELRPQGHPLVSANVVVITPTLRELLGPRLAAAAAPLLLASFGAGRSSVQVRLVARHGVAALDRELTEDRAARVQSGTALLTSSMIVASPLARSQLEAGEVDSRLLVVIALLAARYPTYIAGFSDSGPKAGPQVPYRLVELLPDIGHKTTKTVIQASIAFLEQQAVPYKPDAVKAVMVSGSEGILVEFPAPSPLLLLSPS